MGFYGIFYISGAARENGLTAFPKLKFSLAMYYNLSETNRKVAV